MNNTKTSAPPAPSSINTSITSPSNTPLASPSNTPLTGPSNTETNDLNKLAQGMSINENLNTVSPDNLHRIYNLEIGEKTKKTALLVMNVQNCFFKGGGMAMIPSNDLSQDIENEKDLIRRINNMINLYEEDIDYFNAGLAGSPIIVGKINSGIDDLTGMKLLDGTYPTGSRKKYVFDHIIYAQTGYPPDHHSFASHHYLREKKKKLKALITGQKMSYEEALKKITDDTLSKHQWSYVNNNFENEGMTQFYKNVKLWSDHALIDGSDVIIENQKCYRGIDFHPRLNLGPLYKPNPNIDPSVYINGSLPDGRGKIIWMLGDASSSPRSAFKNDNDQSTGLMEFLQEKKVEVLYVVGLFRDIMVETTAIDAIESGFKNVNLVYDVTLPFNIPTNNTNVNNKYYFKNNEEITRYLEKTHSSDDESKFYPFLKNNNLWATELESKGVNIINYENILEKIIPGKESVHCGINEEGMIKAFDIYVKTGTTTSRLKTSLSDT